jgi:CRP-like cAMP-binding protein
MAAISAAGAEAIDSDLNLGRDALVAEFQRSAPRILRAGQPLASGSRSSDALYRLQAGWAYRYCDLRDGSRAILEVYLPGDIIGFSWALRRAPGENVMTLTTAAVEAAADADGPGGLMASRPVAIYLAWLLSVRQQRADRLLSAISCLDARGRLATMVLDFYERLDARRLISTASFNLPLTQHHIGSYLGLTVVHVNRVIRALRDARIVNIEKHWVTLLDPKALAELAQRDAQTEAVGERPAPTPEVPAQLIG